VYQLCAPLNSTERALTTACRRLDFFPRSAWENRAALSRRIFASRWCLLLFAAHPQMRRDERDRCARRIRGIAPFLSVIIDVREKRVPLRLSLLVGEIAGIAGSIAGREEATSVTSIYPPQTRLIPRAGALAALRFSLPIRCREFRRGGSRPAINALKRD